MRNRSCFVLCTLLISALSPTLSHANARLVGVTPSGGACVAGPTGPKVEAWDVQAGMTYTLTIDQVVDCANGGTDPTIMVMVKNSSIGNIDVMATQVAVGTYAFDFAVPALDCETSLMLYCNEPGRPNTGMVVGRHDDGTAQSHLRVSTWSAGCTSPVAVSCTTPTLQHSWGRLKTIYR